MLNSLRVLPFWYIFILSNEVSHVISNFRKPEHIKSHRAAMIPLRTPAAPMGTVVFLCWDSVQRLSFRLSCCCFLFFLVQRHLCSLLYAQLGFSLIIMHIVPPWPSHGSHRGAPRSLNAWGFPAQLSRFRRSKCCKRWGKCIMCDWASDWFLHQAAGCCMNEKAEWLNTDGTNNVVYLWVKCSWRPPGHLLCTWVSTHL